MKANELRIGNWVYNEVQSLNFQVDGGVIATEYLREKANKNHIGFKPITLTEEWLKKFGFVKIDRCFHKIDFGFYAKKVKDSIGFHIKRNDLSIEVQYVHQFQNFYFALESEELTILDT